MGEGGGKRGGWNGRETGVLSKRDEMLEGEGRVGGGMGLGRIGRSQ
jgi:hypothetical protein